MLMAICNRDPAFLKAVYPLPIKLIDHERHIPTGAKYITYDGRYRIWKMTSERIPIPQGASDRISGAIFMIRRK